jgi:glycosyltransferase involved in cell wall biosynthesis
VEEGAGAPRNPLLVVALYSAIILLEIASTEVPLRVAILASISWRVPPRRYGPWEQFASLLTEGLVRRGVDVTLFATADSITRARLVGTAPTGYSEDPGLHAKAWEALHISSVFERADEFDVIHNSFDFLPLTYAALVDTPVVTTIHGFSSEQIVPVYEKYNEHGYYVAISDADRHDRLDYAATIHHGIDLDEFELQQQAGKYLLFFGRIHPDKGTAEAIDVAERVGMPLTIAGIIQDRDYFERFVEPRLDGENVRYVGPIGPDRRGTVLGGALALLHLVNFDEPFGFSVVEAMACGTPVIAQRRGSMVEIVEDGENGFLVEALDEAVSAVAACAKLDRSRVRASVETRFDVDRMVDDYLALYRQVAAAHAPVVPLPTERFRVGVNYWPVRRR